MINVLFVCTANICRSPMAHGIFRKMLSEHGLDHSVTVESAGISASGGKLRADVRAQRVVGARGIDLSDLRSQQMQRGDCSKYDYILVMDNGNLQAARKLCADESVDKIKLLMHFVPAVEFNDIPDPYFGNITGFERVYDMLEMGLASFIEYIKRHDFRVDNDSPDHEK